MIDHLKRPVTLDQSKLRAFHLHVEEALRIAKAMRVEVYGKDYLDADGLRLLMEKVCKETDRVMERTFGGRWAA